jgi:cytochrome c-type biogenesis protein CcmH
MKGLSEKQIYSYFQSKYGEWILYDPLFNKNTYFLWLLPLLIFFIGGAIVFKNFKKTN